jgi:hypothetical protein
MRQKQVRRLPVVDAQGKLSGILSIADLCVRDCGENDRALLGALAEIARPRTPGVQQGRLGSAVVVPKAPASAPTLAPVSAPVPAKPKERSRKK